MANQLINFALQAASQLRNSPAPGKDVLLVLRLDPNIAGGGEAAASQLNREEQQLMSFALQLAAQLTNSPANEGTPPAAAAAADPEAQQQLPPTDPPPASFSAGNAVLVLVLLPLSFFCSCSSNMVTSLKVLGQAVGAWPPENLGTQVTAAAAAADSDAADPEAQQQLPPTDAPPASFLPGNAVLMLLPLSPSAAVRPTWLAASKEKLLAWYLEKLPSLLGAMSALRPCAPKPGHGLLFKSSGSVLHATILLYMAALGIEMFIGIRKPCVRRATEILTLAGLASFLLAVILGILSLVSV